MQKGSMETKLYIMATRQLVVRLAVVLLVVFALSQAANAAELVGKFIILQGDPPLETGGTSQKEYIFFSAGQAYKLVLPFGIENMAYGLHGKKVKVISSSIRS